MISYFALDFFHIPGLFSDCDFRVFENYRCQTAQEYRHNVDRGQGNPERDHPGIPGRHHRGPEAARRHLGQRACQ